MPLKFIFLPAVLFIGIMTSFEDLISGKIRNIWIIFGFLYGLLAYSVLFFTIRIPTYLLIINFLLSVLVGYGLWYFNQWSPGDGKLFMVYALLTPPEAYFSMHLTFYPAFTLLMYTFVPAAVFVLIRALAYVIAMPEKKKMWHLMIGRMQRGTKGKRLELVKVGAGFTLIFLFSYILSSESSGFISRFIPDNNVLVLVSFIIYRPLSRLFLKNNKALIAVFLLVVLYFALNTNFTSPQERIQALGAQLSRSVFRSICTMSLFFSFQVVTRCYLMSRSSKTMAFAIWMFIGVLFIWFRHV